MDVILSPDAVLRMAHSHWGVTRVVLHLHGGQSQTYLADMPATGKPHATTPSFLVILKQVRPGAVADVRNEIAILLAIAPHENVMEPYLGCAEWAPHEGAAPVLLLASAYRGNDLHEAVLGDPARTRVRFAAPLLPAAAQLVVLDFAEQLVRAVRHVHACGVFHLDIKPENLLVEKLGSSRFRVILMDFGLAARYPRGRRRFQGPWVAAEARQQHPRMVEGEVDYEALDLYSTGLVIVWLFGQLLGRRVPIGAPHELAALVAALPVQIRDAVAFFLSEDPRARAHGLARLHFGREVGELPFATPAAAACDAPAAARAARDDGDAAPATAAAHPESACFRVAPATAPVFAAAVADERVSEKDAPSVAATAPVGGDGADEPRVSTFPTGPSPAPDATTPVCGVSSARDDGEDC